MDNSRVRKEHDTDAFDAQRLVEIIRSDSSSLALVLLLVIPSYIVRTPAYRAAVMKRDSNKGGTDAIFLAPFRAHFDAVTGELPHGR